MRLLRYMLVLLLLQGSFSAVAQLERRIPVEGGNRGNNRNPTNNGEPRSNAPTKDTIPFERRDDAKDAITVVFNYLDSTNKQTLDSSVNNFDTYYSTPLSYQHLGNNGAAAYSLIFKPNNKPGWDPGFHAFDVYKFKLEETKFYKTRRPFSTIGYMLASGAEQMINAGHTQSPRPNLNFGFDYRLISAPGRFVTQNNTHNSSRIFGNYQGKRKRYGATFVFMGNNIKASQNGGIVNDSSLSDPNQRSRFSVPVRLGKSSLFQPNPFFTGIETGSIFKETTLFIRQSYDLGITDSLEVNDSTKEYLFYSKLRFQHTLTLEDKDFRYNDFNADSTYYEDLYNINLNKPGRDSVYFREKWKVFKNDFSILQFPDTKNNSQFFLAGVSLENITRRDSITSNSYFNSFAHAEYRNRTRDKKWNLLASGVFYLTGLNKADYNASAFISRYVSPQFGKVELHFSNTSRTPSFVFDDRSAFHLGNNLNLKKENILQFGAKANSRFVNLSFDNYFINNFTFFKSFTEKEQYNKPINLIQVSASKKIKLTKRINWYPEAVLQQVGADAPINLPLVYTRNRIAFEGLFFKNLNLSTGLDIRYYTPYKAYDYSPINSQFTLQDTTTISNLPDINAYVHFRIKGFTAYVRGENLNTVSFRNGFGFTNNNFAAPHYPTQGFTIRFGIKWWFIN